MESKEHNHTIFVSVVGGLIGTSSVPQVAIHPPLDESVQKDQLSEEFDGNFFAKRKSCVIALHS